MYGVPKGICYGQYERVDELNQRIQSRHFSDKPLAPNFSSRPVMSKQSRFPIIERRAPFQEPIQPVPMHNVQTNFSPATHNGPPSTFLQNIDAESGLRNQTVAYQRYAPHTVHVPHTNSDLYKVEVPFRPGPNPHPSLFVHPSTECAPRAQKVRNINIGKDMFNNNTRTQLRALC
tara:strand:- start:110 stop:634 length:525 start_codon:yes stop_codon:yes gene_type:complete